MLRLQSKQRTELSESVRDLANLVFTAFVLGQFIGGQTLSWELLLAGFGIWILLVGFALVVSGD